MVWVKPVATISENSVDHGRIRTPMNVACALPTELARLILYIGNSYIQLSTCFIWHVHYSHGDRADNHLTLLVSWPCRDFNLKLILLFSYLLLLVLESAMLLFYVIDWLMPWHSFIHWGCVYGRPIMIDNRLDSRPLRCKHFTGERWKWLLENIPFLSLTNSYVSTLSWSLFINICCKIEA